MALLEKEATRFAESLDDYEHVSVTEIGGTHRQVTLMKKDVMSPPPNGVAGSS